MTTNLLLKGPHIHISRIILVLRTILMKVFFCQYYFLNITVITVHFYHFIFVFFKFFFPVVDIIVNHLYLLFLGSRKTNTKCDKNEKISTVISSWRS